MLLMARDLADIQIINLIIDKNKEYRRYVHLASRRYTPSYQRASFFSITRDIVMHLNLKDKFLTWSLI